MDLTNYIKEVQRTINTDYSDSEIIENYEGSLFEELGEIGGVLKKFIWHGHALEETKNKIIGEAGDALWYIFAICIKNNDTSAILFREDLNETSTNITTIKELRVERFMLISQYCEFWSIKELKFAATLKFIAIMKTIISICSYFDISIDDVIKYNSEKLRKRYSEGFSKKESRERTN